MKVTFLVPSDAASGGVRVTMQMGNKLLERGHAVRIAYRRPPWLSRDRWRAFARSVKFRLQRTLPTHWLSYFKGPKQSFANLADLQFEDNEIVISTGIHTIADLDKLQRNVRKIRYCHGLLEHEPEEVRKLWLWRGPMDTIAVSPALVPALRNYCEGRILGVVPNGIAFDEYFLEGQRREGVGLIYGRHPVKGPEVALALVQALRARFPEIPLYCFGSSRRPAALPADCYTRFPSIEIARQIYNRCKVWVVTSRDEGFCLPILEAMACGCAVISSDHTNASELIQHGRNGFIVPYGKVDAYLDLIRRIANNDALRKELVQSGLETVKGFTWDRAADQMELVLELAAAGAVR
jgi:glycosyltransferase involved in cell wall biosynthesis